MKKTSRFRTLAHALALGWLALLAVQAHGQGGLPLWTNSYHGPRDVDSPTAIAVDSTGKVFVTGASEVGTNGFLDAAYDYATVAYSRSGMPLWTNRYGGFRLVSKAVGAVVGPSGNVFVTGTSTDIYGHYATVAYSNAGQPLWTNRYLGSDDDDLASAVALGSNGNVFVTGTFGANTYDLADYGTFAYSSTGMPLWTNRYNGPENGYDAASAIAVDGAGNAFVTGTSFGTNNGPELYATVAYSGTGASLWTNYCSYGSASAIAVDDHNVLVVGNSYGADGHRIYATVAYSTAGVPLWTNRYHGSANGEDLALALAVDLGGNVFVTGIATGGGGTTVAYSSAGAPLWTNRHDVFASAVAVDSSGNVLVTGYSTNISGGSDFATVAYAGAGMPLWTNRYHAYGWSKATAIAVDNNGNVLVTGESLDSALNPHYATIKYSSSVRPSLHIARIDNQIVLNWTNADFTLQTAPAVSGAFTNIPGATSPYTNPADLSQQYFQLKAP